MPLVAYAIEEYTLSKMMCISGGLLFCDAL